MGAGVATSRLAPRDAAELAEIVRAHPRPLEPLGFGSKRSIGRPIDADPLDLSALDGILAYEPDELVVTARAATPLAVVETALAAHGQRLAFEPPDYGPLLGVAPMQTLGGVLAANLAGSRRVTAGAARDHFLGFEAVSGHGKRFKAGGKVVKNVTGYDLPKLVAGSWGTLAVLTEVTLRVAPAPETETTLIVESETPARAVELMAQALGSSCDVSSAAFDPRQGVALRLEGFTASVDARAAALSTLLDAGGTALEPPESRAFWARHGGAHALADWPVVWRISIPPSHAPRVLASLAAERYLLDWGGGLIWAAYGRLDVARVRGALRAGHATLVKAPASARRETCSFPPPPASLAAVHARIKLAFDPDNRLNPGKLD
ncbi:MAG TPA: FAD-binding protein [Gammaproteobacteria bacterium]